MSLNPFVLEMLVISRREEVLCELEQARLLREAEQARHLAHPARPTQPIRRRLAHRLLRLAEWLESQTTDHPPLSAGGVGRQL